jgi:hydrogenase maturation protein HypF
MRTIKLPFRVKRPILACGADMKGAFALARSDKAYLFDGFGDLSDLDNYTRYENAVRETEKRLKIKPEMVVCDLHPGYFSTQFAGKNRDRHHFSGRTAGRKIVSVPIFQAQHHEAHIASAIIDNDIKGEVLGVAFDGTGYGTDGKIWGGEFFAGNAKKFKRVAHLEYLPMPGGEMCIKEPWRMAASYIYAALKNRDGFIFSGRSSDKKNEPVPIFPIFLFQMIEKNINSPMTSSMGRLFDAVGSLVLNKELSGFEAELPIELEKIVDKDERGHYGFEFKKRDGPDSIDVSKAIKGILKDLNNKVPRPKISAKFHNSIAEIILSAAKKAKIKKVVLSGGVFQNKYLVDRTVKLLNQNSFKTYVHRNVQTNDSGIPIGQIAIANARAACV